MYILSKKLSSIFLCGSLALMLVGNSGVYAGNGALEDGLPEDILEHFIISTIDDEEYSVLHRKFEGKVRHIISEYDLHFFSWLFLEPIK